MRDDDNSDACDEAPRAEDKCYTKGRLRDKFRMKPAPGAEPVRMYKSPYGGKYGVWWLADCVPMRAKRPQTENSGWPAQANRGEGRHAVARTICYGQKESAIGKGRKTNWTRRVWSLTLLCCRTHYMQEALSHIRTKADKESDDEHIARLSALMHGHIDMLRHYTFTLPEDILKRESFVR
ncbi:Tn3 family transposase [Salmonella enterica]|nr:hypothetical protein [Salmonella enterica]ECW2407993.1 Tn3 family transposase [Salmonella enterica]EDV4312673.1 transposase [Salmonella enterica subsp. enterica]